MYTADDVRALYKRHSDKLTAKLTDEQANLIASVWATIDESVAHAYEDNGGDNTDAFNHFLNLAIIAARIVDGTLTLDELIKTENRLAGAMIFAYSATDAAMFTLKAMGEDTSQAFHQVKESRAITRKSIEAASL